MTAATARPDRIAPPGFDRALTLHQQGKLVEAHALYTGLLSGAPNNADLHHLLGVLAGQLGDHGEAATRIAHAILLDGLAPEYHVNLSVALERLGRVDDAAAASAEAGLLLLQGDKAAEAISAFDRALALAPGHRASILNRASTLCRLGRHGEAQQALEARLKTSPEDATAWNNLGNVAIAQDRVEQAALCFREALARDPSYAEAHSNLGLALLQLGDIGGAERAARQALSYREPFPEAYVNLGIALRGQAPIEEVVGCFRRAVALKPDLPAAHWNLSHALLAAGAFEEGWAEYEWRWRWPEFDEPARSFAHARAWRGEAPEDLDGPLLVTAEQGHGDTIQFCRYAIALAELGYDVLLEVQGPLYTLMWSSLAAAGVKVIARCETPDRVQADARFAAHAPLLSLPGRLGTTVESIPAHVPYLAAPPALVARWRERLQGRLGDAPRVGLVWAGSPTFRTDRARSVPIDLLEPLAAIAGVRLVSLQRGAQQERTALGGAALEPVGPDLLDFADTAAVIANLDLVISVDTAVAHLAGALGRPCWVLLPTPADWRWLLDREDSPWYPRHRLYRQQRRNDWSAPINRLAVDLATWASAGL